MSESLRDLQRIMDLEPQTEEENLIDSLRDIAESHTIENDDYFIFDSMDDFLKDAIDFLKGTYDLKLDD